MKHLINVLIFVQLSLLSLGLQAQSKEKGTRVPVSKTTNPIADQANIVPKDTPVKKVDTSQVRIIANLKKKSDLDAPVDYSAEDSIVFDMENKILYLFKDGEVEYDEINLTADSMAIDFGENLLHAAGKQDSNGQIKGQPTFKDQNQDYGAKKITFNYKTRRGKVQFAKTSLGTEYLQGESVKLDGKTADGKNIVYIRDGKFTSCELDHPHFYIRSRKLKIIPGDRIISGPLQLVIEDFPIPIYLPFGFFPNQETRRSGILLPTYGERGDRGFFLKDLGYYWAINDKVDVKVLADVYTRGGYRIGLGSKYKSRYRFSGNVLLQYSRIKFGEKIDPDYSVQNEFFVDWTHDQKISPSTKVSAKVRAGTSGFLTSNSYNQRDLVTNQLRSSINFSHKFINTPWRMQVNLNHSQNTKSRSVTLGLPTVNLNRSRTFPFKGSTRRKNFWAFLDNLGYSYKMDFKNSITAPDSILGNILFSPTQQIESISIDDETGDTIVDLTDPRDFFRNGVKHTIPISTKITVAKYLNLSPSFNFHEYWYFREREKNYVTGFLQEPAFTDTLIDQGGTASDLMGKTQFNPIPYGEDQTTLNNGFFTTRDFNLSLNASTQFYGFYASRNGKRESTIRHSFNPTISYNYKPDFSEAKWNVYRTVQTDTSGETDTYNRFSGSILGSPSKGEQQQINFGLNNRLELKRIKKGIDKDSLDTDQLEEMYEKTVLLDNLGFSGNYNFAKDSLKLSTFSMNARTSLFNRKVTLQVDGRLDPYQVVFDSLMTRATRVDRFMWNKSGGGIGRISSFRITVGTAFRAPIAKKKGKIGRADRGEENTDLMFYRAQYVDYDIPWTLNVNYNLSYTNNGLKKDTTQTVRVTGDFSLTPRWKMTFSSGYDLTDMEFNLTRIGIRRDLHCWEMSMDWTPFGNYKSFLFTLAVKNPTLKDLKITKRSDYQDRQF